MSGESDERDFNPRVARALDKALKLITSVPRRHNAFQLARQRILRYANHLMSRRQRARVLYILGQAYTTLGDEFTARDERESGLYCYRAALDVLGRSDVRHLSRWPRYALLMDGETHVG